MSHYYTLEGHNAVPCDGTTWAKRFETAERRVALDNINGVKVSTVFLGLDHNFGSGPPLLFETMVFGGKYDQEQWRYSTWDEAEQGHKRIVEEVKSLPDSKAVIQTDYTEK